MNKQRHSIKLRSQSSAESLVKFAPRRLHCYEALDIFRNGIRLHVAMCGEGNAHQR